MITQYNCIKCNNLHFTKDLILFHELKDVYGNVYGKMYICKHCNKKEEMKKELDHKATLDEYERIQKECNELIHDKNYDNIIGKKVLDVLSNKNNITQLKFENGIKINFEKYPEKDYEDCEDYD